MIMSVGMVMVMGVLIWLVFMLIVMVMVVRWAVSFFGWSFTPF